MNKILFALCGTMVLVLLALSPAYAQPFYYSEIVCLPEFADRGFVTIQHPTGDLTVHLQTDGPPIANITIHCQITCNNPNGSFVLGRFPCAKNPGGPACATNSAGKVDCEALRLGNVPLCVNPVVEVFDDTIVCTSGYPTPQ